MKKNLLLLTALLSIAVVSCKKEGCTDPEATNYSKKAKVDDGTCKYPEGTITLTITEDITESTTIANQTVSICGDIRVSSSLIIEPGATLIMCAGASITIEETGYISAIGTADKPIMIKGATETKGFWEGLAIKSNNPNNKLNYVTVKDAGTYWGWSYANVFLSPGAKLEMSNSTISNSDDIGLYVSESASLPNFVNNKFSNNTTGLDIHVKTVHQLDAASNYNDANTNAFIYVRAGTITSDVTWAATTTPYLITGLYVEAGLTVNAGAKLLMEADSYIGVKPTGYFKAVGTVSSKIDIIGRYTSAGFWGGMKFDSSNPNNELNYVNISDGGGYWGYSYANIEVTGNLKIDNCSVTNANSWGLNASTSSSVTSGGVVQTTGAGVEANNSFSGNGNGPDANCTAGCGVNFE
jgi:hypothetical protein